MRNRRRSTGYIAFASLFATSPIALADAPCHTGFRDVTPAEQTRITTALAAAESAVPPAPEGWQIRGEGPHSVSSSICKDGEKNLWQYGFSRSYGRVDGLESRQKVFQDAAAAAAALRAKNQARMDAIQAEMMSINQQQIALNQKRDYAGAEKLQPQAEKLQAEYEKLVTAGNAGIEAAGKEMERDLQMSVYVEMNTVARQPEKNATKMALPAGAATALRWQNADPEITEEYALYLFGPWRQRAEGGWSPGVRTGVPASSPHAVSVYVIADRDRLASIVQKIDFAKIATIAK